MSKIFNTEKHGYSKEEVDAYIKALEDVINTYKEKDNSIRNAIVNAQVAADNIVKNAKLEAENIVSDAQNEVDKIRLKNKAQFIEIKNLVDLQEEKINSFKEDYIVLLNKYLKEISEVDFVNMQKALEEVKKGLS